MKRIILIGIILLAAVLRLWQLGSVPISPDWDEAALGYNAYSILHTGRDEYGKFMPVVLQSFGDYKPALYTYLAIPSVAVLGLNTVSVRLPSAVFGILTVLFVYFLIQELFPEGFEYSERFKIRSDSLALFVSFLLAISPWHIQFSRVAFETNIGLSLNILGVLFFLKGLRKGSLLSISAFFFAASIYAYQSEKVFVPLLVLILILVYWKKVFALSKKYLFYAAIVGILLSLPMGLFILTNKDALSRAAGVSIFAAKTDVLKSSLTDYQYDVNHGNILGEIFDNRRIVFAKDIVNNYLAHYNPNWLFITGDPSNNRHHVPQMSLLYISLIPFLLIGIYTLFFGDRKNRISLSTKLFVLLWFLVAPIPASITQDIPHAVRTMNFLPTFEIFSALGLIVSTFFVTRLVRFSYIRYVLFAVVGIIFAYNFVYYLDQYFVQQNYAFAYDWQYGYEKVVPYVASKANQYQKIIVSNQGQFSQSYIFFLFYLHYDPSQYLAQGGTKNGGNFANYVFEPINYSAIPSHSLIVGPNIQNLPNSKTLYHVSFPNGLPAMTVVEKE